MATMPSAAPLMSRRPTALAQLKTKLSLLGAIPNNVSLDSTSVVVRLNTPPGASIASTRKEGAAIGNGPPHVVLMADISMEMWM